MNKFADDTYGNKTWERQSKLQSNLQILQKATEPDFLGH